MSDHVLFFGWQTPPLTENQRWSHWSRKAEVVRDVRATTRLWGRSLRDSGRVEVTLTWVVADRRRRDADNIIPTLKALCDGLVDAGVVKDDTPEFMVKHMPIIEYRKGAVPHMILTVSVLNANLD